MWRVGGDRFGGLRGLMVVWGVSLHVLAVEFVVFEIGFLNVGRAF